jgi:hypothetical protein
MSCGPDFGVMWIVKDDVAVLLVLLAFICSGGTRSSPGQDSPAYSRSAMSLALLVCRASWVLTLVSLTPSLGLEVDARIVGLTMWPAPTNFRNPWLTEYVQL